MFEDESVYVGGDEEIIFEGGEDALASALAYLERKGYQRKE